MSNAPGRTALINGRVLRDDGFSDGLAVLLDGERIVAVVPHNEARLNGVATVNLRGQRLMPGFIDTQVNGGGGVLFNDAPTVASIRAIGRAHRRFGTTGFLPTLISDDAHVIETAIAAVRDAMRAQVPGVLGIHVEGPFLNPERKGAHDASKLRRLDAAAVKLLATPTGGRTMLTLAPEMTDGDTLAALDAAGVVLSAGHTNATYSQVQQALGAGLRGFTHLFNAMSQLGNREPGVVGAALEDAASWCGIIVDGHHVDPVVLRLALRCKPAHRFMLVSDAMPNIGTDLAGFELAGKHIRVIDGKLLDDAGTLAGANLHMAGAVANAIELLGVDAPRAARMASANPAAFLKLDGELGRIEPGYRASLVLADEKMNVLETWVDGTPSAD